MGVDQELREVLGEVYENLTYPDTKGIPWDVASDLMDRMLAAVWVAAQKSMREHRETSSHTCHTCQGSGQVKITDPVQIYRTGGGWEKCDTCRGSGEVSHTTESTTDAPTFEDIYAD